MKLKICGMKYQDNIKKVAALQPDYLGFIFYEKSKRHFGENFMPQIPHSIKKTGVFVDTEINEAIDKINFYHLYAVQLHGNESPEYCEKLKTYNIEIIKAFSIDENFNFDDLKSYETVCDYFLFDTKGKLPGGNGYTFDWSLLENYSSKKPFFLSGGIGIEQTKELKTFLQSEVSNYCYAIDVNSKFEIEAGLKDIEKLKELKNLINEL